MDEIPEDVMKAAREVRRGLCIDSECAFDRGCGCLSALAEAILAERMKERARCAEIAEDEDGRFSWAGMDRNARMLQQCCREIASAIRGEDNGKG